MRPFFLLLLFSAADLARGTHAQAPWVPDLGHGQYKNPVLYADPAVVRVGPIITSPRRASTRCRVCPFCIPKTW